MSIITSRDVPGSNITPENIDTTKENSTILQRFGVAFENYDSGIAAVWLVRFCQERGAEKGWSPFTEDQLLEFYPDYEGFFFNGLLEWEYVVEEGGQYFFTEEFVKRCHEASPRR